MKKGLILLFLCLACLLLPSCADKTKEAAASITFSANGDEIRPGGDGTARVKQSDGCVAVRVSVAAAQADAKLSDELYFENHLLYSNTCGTIGKMPKENYRELTLQPPVKLDKSGRTSYDKWKKGQYTVKIYAVDDGKKKEIASGGFVVQ